MLERICEQEGFKQGVNIDTGVNVRIRVTVGMPKVRIPVRCPCSNRREER